MTYVPGLVYAMVAHFVGIVESTEI